jgi:hypothetical protein
MFNITLSDSYEWPVELEVPGDSKNDRSTFKVTFRRVDQAEVYEIQRLIDRQRFQGPDDPVLVNDQMLAERVLAGWPDGEITETVKGEAVPISYSVAARASLLAVAKVASAITAAWRESLQDARAKN